MWVGIAAALGWILDHWKGLARIASTFFGSFLAAWGIYQGLKALGTWLFGRTAQMFDFFSESIDDIRTLMADFEVEYSDSFVGMIVKACALDEFATAVLGWVATFGAILGWVFTGIIIAAVGYIMRLIYIKFQKTLAELAAEGVA